MNKRATNIICGLGIVLALAGGGYYIARHYNPSKPLIGDPTAQHWEYFARRFNNELVGTRKVPVNEYHAELRRTDSMTNPIVGEFACLIDGTPEVMRFGWQHGDWVLISSKLFTSTEVFKDEIAAAQRRP
jgi:hypothetical protein